MNAPRSTKDRLRDQLLKCEEQLYIPTAKLFIDIRKDDNEGEIMRVIEELQEEMRTEATIMLTRYGNRDPEKLLGQPFKVKVTFPGEYEQSDSHTTPAELGGTIRRFFRNYVSPKNIWPCIISAVTRGQHDHKLINDIFRFREDDKGKTIPSGTKIQIEVEGESSEILIQNEGRDAEKPVAFEYGVALVIEKLAKEGCIDAFHEGYKAVRSPSQ